MISVHGEMMAFAHAIEPILIDLDAHFDKPIQGEASHKVIGRPSGPATS